MLTGISLKNADVIETFLGGLKPNELFGIFLYWQIGCLDAYKIS
jgi:hypothetical protein